MKFSEVLDVLCRITPAIPRHTIIARTKQWAKAPYCFPDGVNVGRGTKLDYTNDQALDIVLLYAFNMMGLPPNVGVTLIRQRQWVIHKDKLVFWLYDGEATLQIEHRETVEAVNALIHDAEDVPRGEEVW